MLSTIDTNIQHSVARAFERLLHDHGYPLFEEQAAKAIVGLAYVIYQRSGPDRVNQILEEVPVAIEKALTPLVKQFQIIPDDASLPIRRGAAMVSTLDDLDCLRGYLGGASGMRIGVVVGGQTLDMFVDELGSLKDLPRNERATTLYRGNHLAKNPGADPERLPAVYGPAVLFDEPIGFD
ncbi:hypothetical protein [Bradyrhizobium sp. SEMIA]|uniref:hypothetical protein n=1 Tax=Bradyrhizobium sp. SEMIA TaxID=2597515 RepID=UPI0018A50C55|nr:hypothetical protein [Bradyrhizobium sp. SEMIA]QOG17538.1 hypothetical protein FOM02_09465 [Bradyrhizobium sp. SEMIA]